MRLTPTERDRLDVHLAALLARARRERGLLLNIPEAAALIADAVAEAARDGASHEQAVAAGAAVLRPQDVLPGVAAALDVVHVEAVFADGSRLVSIPHPLGPRQEAAATSEVTQPAVVHVDVENLSAVTISVSSHFHFFEINPRLKFDRVAGYGRHLAIPAGATVRFPPGEVVTVGLADIAGARVIVGFAGLVDGPLDVPGAQQEALRRLRACGFSDSAVAIPSEPEGAIAALMEQR